MSSRRETLERLIAAKEREVYAAYRNEEPLHEQELGAALDGLREELADLDTEEALDEANEQLGHA